MTKRSFAVMMDKASNAESQCKRRRRKEGDSFEDEFEKYLNDHCIPYHRNLKFKHKGQVFGELDFVVPGASIEMKSGTCEFKNNASKIKKQIAKYLVLTPAIIHVYFVFERELTEQEVKLCMTDITSDTDRQRLHMVCYSASSGFRDIIIQNSRVLIPSVMGVWYLHYWNSPELFKYVQDRQGRKWIVHPDDWQSGISAKPFAPTDHNSEYKQFLSNLEIMETSKQQTKSDLVARFATGEMGFVEMLSISSHSLASLAKQEKDWSWNSSKMHLNRYPHLGFFVFLASERNGACNPESVKDVKNKYNACFLDQKF